MACTVAVASGPLTAKSASQIGLPSSFSAPPHRPRTMRKSLPLRVAATRRDHGSYSHDDDSDQLPSTSSSSYSSGFPSFSSGRSVDEGMLILRKCIRDAQMAEMNYEPPKDWTNWERAYYTKYGSDVCAALGVLQAFLLSKRPSIALGAAAVVALSLPVSAGAVLFAAIQGARVVGVGMGLW